MLFISKITPGFNEYESCDCVYLLVFQSRLQVGEVKLHGVSPVLFMSRWLRQLCVRSTWQKPSSKNMLWETSVIIASLFPKVLENAHCTVIQKFWPSVCMKYSMGWSLLWRWDVPGWWNLIRLC